jgi:DNA-binding NarL/FixJ family response regulator
VPGVERVTTAANGEEDLRRWGADRSDLILMDVRMPGLGGVETVRRLLSADPGARIIMLTVAEDLDGVALAVAAGARGYLHKDASRAELRATVTQALADPTWRLAPRRLRSSDMGAAPTLTAREIQVLEGMSHGRSNAEIGRELFLSEDTVKTHARRLFKKLGASDRAHAVALAGHAWRKRRHGTQKADAERRYHSSCLLDADWPLAQLRSDFPSSSRPAVATTTMATPLRLVPIR